MAAKLNGGKASKGRRRFNEQAFLDLSPWAEPFLLLFPTWPMFNGTMNDRAKILVPGSCNAQRNHTLDHILRPAGSCSQIYYQFHQ